MQRFYTRLVGGSKSSNARLKAHLRGKLQDFIQTGRVTLLVSPDGGKTQQERTFSQPHELTPTLLDIARAGDVYPLLREKPDGQTSSYLVGDVLHIFSVGETSIFVVVDCQSDGSIPIANTAYAYALDGSGRLRVSNIAIFPEADALNLDFPEGRIGELLRSLVDRPTYVDTVFFEAVIGEIAYARLVQAGFNLNHDSIRAAAALISPYPKVSFLRALANSQLMADAIGFSADQLMTLPDYILNPLIRGFSERIFQNAKYPSLDTLIPIHEQLELQLAAYGSI